MTIELREPTDADLIWLADHLRAADIAEAEDFSGQDALTALRKSVAVSSECTLALADGDPLLIFGLGYGGSLFSDTARPWMVGTDAIPCYRVTLHRTASRLVRRWRGERGLLENWVDARHAVSIGWLKRLGFVLDDPVPAGPKRLPAHRFEMKGA